MRIISLEIKSPWKNLEGLSIEFDKSKDVTVIIGRNGSAKSNLLEAIIHIFRNISLNEPAAFSYKISYNLYSSTQINNGLVEIESEHGSQPKATFNEKKVSLELLRSTYTPKYVVGYYSGVSDRFEELFHKHDRRALNETLETPATKSKPGKLEFRRFIYARPVHGLFVLLAFYFSNDKEVDSFLKSYPRIEGFDSALLTVKKPDWALPKSTADDFWGAKGPVRDLLERFKNYSLAPFSRKLVVSADFRRKETREVIHLFIPDIASLRGLAKEYGEDPRALFQALDTMRLSGLIDDFRVRVKVKGAKGPIHTRQLSEGEQQLLTVLGLMRFTQDEGSLYVLDEPDTHLNPTWGVEYLDHLRKIGGIYKNSHTLLATHQPLLVAGLVKEEIRVMTRGSDGKIRARMPDENPRGTGVASVLTSPLYGLDSQLDLFSLRVLKRIYDLSMHMPSKFRSRHLQRLRRLIPSLESRESSPDPYKNIAKEAYEMALDNIISGDLDANTKIEAVKNLSDLLYKKSINGAE
jgi:predicted ATPase